MAAYHILMAGHTGSERVVISTTTLGRTTNADKLSFGQFTNDLFVSARIRRSAPLEHRRPNVLSAKMVS
jgi:hypothetical protein